jgi:hypothetical protein
MSVEKIRIEDMPVFQRGMPRVEEMLAVRALLPGEAIKFPCRWRHFPKTNMCAGVSSAHTTAKRSGFKTSGTCRDGYVYIARPA